MTIYGGESEISIWNFSFLPFYLQIVFAAISEQRFTHAVYLKIEQIRFGLEVIKLSCSTQLSIKFQLLI